VIRRIVLLLVVALVVVALAVGPASAKQAVEGPQGTGKTETHQGNSVNSPVVACHHGAAGSSGSEC
jgi:hypothetical protein